MPVSDETLEMLFTAQCARLNLTKAVATMPDLSPLTENHWTWFIFGLFTGIALALWLARLFGGARESVPPPRLEKWLTASLADLFGVDQDSLPEPEIGE